MDICVCRVSSKIRKMSARRYKQAFKKLPKTIYVNCVPLGPSETTPTSNGQVELSVSFSFEEERTGGIELVPPYTYSDIQKGLLISPENMIVLPARAPEKVRSLNEFSVTYEDESLAEFLSKFRASWGELFKKP